MVKVERWDIVSRIQKARRSYVAMIWSKKMHKTPIKHVEICIVNFQDVNSLTHHGRRQAIHAPNVDQMLQPCTPNDLQQKVDDSSLVDGYDELDMADIHDG